MLLSMLGCIRYYCKFIKGYVELMVRMEKIFHKRVPIVWAKACKDEIVELKKRMENTPILYFLD